MDVESSFLYRKIKEEVYVCQPLGFEDPNFPVRVYNVEKAMYGLHQALRAWYETLSTYPLDNEFQRGKINKTLFIKRYKGNILLVQVYMDDIIFGSTKKELCNAFEKLMHEKFQMSSMGELTFFLGLQVEQKNDGRFISQDKYVGEILKKFRFTEVKTASTPIETQKPLLKDEDGEEVDVHMYSSQLWFIMCILTSSRPDIMFAVCACARYQVNPKVSHLHDVKRFLAYTDSDYARVSLDRKSTIGGCQFLGCRLILWQCKKQTVVTNSTTEVEPLVDGIERYLTESTIKRDLQLEDVEGVDCLPNATIFEQLTLIGSKTTAWNEFSSTMASAIIYEAVYKELDDSLVRAATTSSSLEAKQDNGGGPRRQETMGDTIAQTRFENVSKHSNNLLLRVFDLETTKTTQGNEITSLKRRVKKLKEKNRVESSGDEEDLEVVDAAQVSTAATTVTITTEAITLAQALEALKTSKPKAKIKADHELAQRLQAEEQEELSDAEKATLFQ
ncbi:putative ribonuclease H-like domain-containing protein [Tanacetum coccineum]